MKLFLPFLLFAFITGNIFAQERKVEDTNQKYLNWQNKDFATDKVLGTSVDKLYNTALKDIKPKKTVVVAVIDGGVDINHEDLAGQIWVNEDEIVGNNIDDDNNGYVDDIHGWNFIGNSSGKNITYENLEYTRIVKAGDETNKDYAAAKSKYDAKLAEMTEEKKNVDGFEKVYLEAKSIIYKKTGIEVHNLQDLSKVDSYDNNVLNAKQFLKEKYSLGFTEEDLAYIQERNAEYLDFLLNLEYNPREVIGDNPLDLKDRAYGNNDVKGPRADHGTSVAGVIAGLRNNGLGINGIATDVKIMVIRSTPKGDERDKDVALAIIYAVDNGADIINMSFGKEFSPNKEFVDNAVKYAEDHNVLIVHSAGNYGLNLDLNESFPSDRYIDRTEAKNWISVGASDMLPDMNLAGIFSNYGVKHVDIFAPGVNVTSLDTCNTYDTGSGTSIASPVVTGIAALILSYYPDLKPEELIQIIMESANKANLPKKVLVPCLSSPKRKKVKFSELSKSGGIINAYDAFMLVQERYK